MSSPDELRKQYPRFVFQSYSHRLEGDRLICEFTYTLPPDHSFTHTVTFQNLKLVNWSTVQLDNLVFNLGLSEMFSYWKLTSSSIIELTTHNPRLTTDQLAFWHKLLIRGMGQYFYENHVDFTLKDFVAFKISEQKRQSRIDARSGTAEAKPTGVEHVADEMTNPHSHTQVLVPIGGGKDSIVTAELLKPHFDIRPLIVYPTTPASLRISALLGHSHPITVHRTLDPLMLQLTKQGYLTGHIPYSAALAFIFLFVASTEDIPYIAVSNERSSDEGNVEYLGHTVNHQYSKSLEFETDLRDYISQSLNLSVSYFSFLRPLYELQIAKLFAAYPRYFREFRSCNRNQNQDSWCGRCPKCISIAMSLSPWLGPSRLVEIMGTNPLTDPANQSLIDQMADPAQVKPFECIVSTNEAQVCQEFISQGLTPRVTEFLNQWGPAPNLPPQFTKLLRHAYTHS